MRYFGGVKLGVGGLISAYKAAADSALGNAVITEKDVTETAQLTHDYGATPEVMRLVREFDLVIQSRKFETSCELVVQYKLRDKEKLFERLTLLKAMGAKVDGTQI